MGYRAEVDGLRAVAVLAVVLFHVDAGLLPGGYLGVDVFFVISGYLITGIVLDELARGDFAWRRFYERRARRIVPAFFLMLLAVTPVVAVLLWPGDQADYGWSLAAASSFTSNLFFWAQSGYFAPAAELQPLLHTWSLAVEAQFYLLYPLLLVFSQRWWPRVTVAVMSVLALLGLLIAQWLTHQHDAAAFYWLPTRAWELLAGGLLAAGRIPGRWRLDGRSRELLVALGMGAILGSMVVFDATTRHPGVVTLIPVLGTVVVLAAARPGGLVTRVLASPPLVGLGLISYSLYLWHYPILALMRYRTGFELSSTASATAVLAAFALAALSWRYVESPVRRRRLIPSAGGFVGYTAALGLSLGCLGTALAFSYQLGFGTASDQRIAGIVAEYEKRLDAGKGSPAPLRCFLDPDQGPAALEADCFDADPKVLIWGDSHARALARGLNGQNAGLSLITASGCPPLAGVEVAQRPHCQAVNVRALRHIQKAPPDAVLLHANWLLYQPDGWGALTSTDAFLERLTQTVTRIRGIAPGARVVVVGLVPQWHPSLPARMAETGVDLARRAYVHGDRTPSLRALNARIAERLETLSAPPGWYDPIADLCKGSACLATVRGRDGRLEPLAWDYSHLTQGGADLVARRLMPILKP